MTEFVDEIQVVMPKLGLTMTEAKIVAWHKGEGEVVEKGEILFTLETEKTTLDIEAPESGMLRIIREEGETVPVQTLIGKIGLIGGAQSESGQSAAVAAEHAVSSTVGAGDKIRATPKARQFAHERDVPLTGLKGTGPRDMVVLSDVVAAAKAKQPRVRATPVARRIAAHLGVELNAITGTGPRGQITRSDVEKAAEQTSSRALSAAHPSEISKSEPQERGLEPLSGLRAIIADRMSTGWRERPQVTLMTEGDATDLVNARRQLNEELENKVSYNALLIRAVAIALREYPYMNVQLTDAGVQQMFEINVGLAVDTERGLMVPVIRNADTKGILTINRELNELTQRALTGGAYPDDLTGGTFTVTNLGMFEVEAFTPIINPPESAILGVGSIVAKPVVVDEQVVVRQRVTLSLAFDHRVVDGAPAARFLQRVKRLIEQPIVLILHQDGLDAE